MSIAGAKSKRRLQRALFDCAAGVYRLGGREYANLTGVPGVTLSGAGGVALTPRGRLVPFPAGVPRLVAGEGLLLEAAARNKVTGYSAAPINANGWTKSTTAPTTVTITVVDDTAALYAAQDAASGEYIFRALMDAGVMNGKVYRFYNPDPVNTWFVSVPGTTGSTAPHSIGAYVRCLSGSGDIRIFSAATSEAFTGAHWRRIVRSNITPANGAARLSVAAAPLSEILIVLPDLHEAPVISSPIITAGAAVFRPADVLAMPGAGRLLAPPMSLAIEAHIAQANSTVRRLVTASNGLGQEWALSRTADNALSGTMTGSLFIPRLPNVFGPGAIRAAIRVRERGRSIALGGLLAHEPVPLSPARLERLDIGRGRSGEQPAVMWLRSLRILGNITDGRLAALADPPADSLALDLVRYIDPAGNDAANGKTPATAWASLSKGADGTIPGGTHVLLKRGGLWPGGLLVKSYCTYGAYGVGDRPKFGAGVDFAIDENSATAVRVQGLHVSGSAKIGVYVYGGDGRQFGGWQIVDNEVSHIGVAGGPDYQGIQLRLTRNVYLAQNYVHDVYGDCVWAQSIRGRVIDHDGHYDTPLGSAADCWQASTCEEVEIRRATMNMRTQPTDSGKGALVVQATSLTLEDFDIRGLNFGVGLNCDNAIVRRGVIRNGDQQSYSWGIGITESSNVRNHLYEDLLIEDCNRGVAMSGIGGGVNLGPTRIDVVARRIIVRDCRTGLFVDRPTSGDLLDLTYQNCLLNKDVRSTVIPAGGRYSVLRR